MARDHDESMQSGLKDEGDLLAVLPSDADPEKGLIIEQPLAEEFAIIRNQELVSSTIL